MSELPIPDVGREPEKKPSGLPRAQVVRLVATVVLAGIVLSFFIQNSQTVTVKFWFIDRHPPLIFIVIACFLIGGVVGYVAGFRRRGRRERRRRHGDRESRV